MEDNPNMILECHWHEEWEIFSIFEGCAYFIVNGKRYLLKEKDMFFLTGGLLHMAEPCESKPCRYHAIVFSPSMLYGLSSDIVQTKYIEPLLNNKTDILLSNEDSVHILFCKLFNLLSKKPPVYEMLAKSYLYEILANIILLNKPKEIEVCEDLISNTKHIKKSINYINQAYVEHITIPELAKMANMSTGHFIKLFKQMTSLSPIDYLIRLRLSKAAEKLCQTKESISNIAMDSGFNNFAYFTRTFQKKFGCTPSEYRKKGNLSF